MPIKSNYIRPLDIKHGQIDITHGAGGKASHQLINELFIPAFDNAYLRQGNDGTTLPPLPAEHSLVMATDAHVISPLFFPGGDIGSLAVHGTVNDLAMMGALPLYLSVSFILEEGLALIELKRIVQSMAQAAQDAGLYIVTGDTKVVEKGKGDGVFISTTGVGALAPSRVLHAAQVQVGDAILVSGSLGEHGVAVLSIRESLAFDSPITSDSAALNGLVETLFSALPAHALHMLRDPTRGGLATSLNEITRQSGMGMVLEESAIPILPEVNAACELLGLDPLYLANEGKFIAIVAAEYADAAVAALRAHPLGARAARIGSVIKDAHSFVQMNTRFGGTRVLDWLSGDPLPRIC